MSTDIPTITLDEVFHLYGAPVVIDNKQSTEIIEESDSITFYNYIEKGYEIVQKYDGNGRCYRTFQKIDKSIVHVQLTAEQLSRVSPLVGFFANLDKNSK